MKSFFKFFVSRVFFINLILVAVAMFFGYKYLNQYLSEYTMHGKTYPVPNFTGIQMRNLEDFNSGSEINYVIYDSVFSTQFAPGSVVNQNPLPHQEVKKGRTVYLTIVRNEQEMIEIPDCYGKSRRWAETKLVAGNLNLKFRYKPSPNCFDCILEQRYEGDTISGGTKIPTGSTLVLVLGQGLSENLIEVPALVGRTRKWIMERYKDSGHHFVFHFDDNIITSEDSVSAIVGKQVPLPQDKSYMKKGKIIELWIAQ